MKILLDKPASTPSNANKSAQSSENMLDLLTDTLFSNTLNNMQEVQEPVIDSESSQPAEINEDNIQQDLDVIMTEMMQQMVNSEPAVRQKEPVKAESTGFDLAANAVIDNLTNAVEAQKSETFKHANLTTTVDENVGLINQLPNQSNQDDTYYHEAPKDRNEKFDNQETVAQKKLTVSVKLSESVQNTNEMNALAMKNPLQDTSVQSGIIHKTLHQWVDKINTEAPAITPSTNPVMTQVSLAEAPKTDTLQLSQEVSLLKSTRQEPMNFHIDTIQQDPVQPESYKVVIKATPPELGPVHATLKMDKNKVDIKIVTTNAHAEQVIKHHIAALSDQLNKNAMQLDKIDIQQQPSLSFNNDPNGQSGAKYSPEESHSQADMHLSTPKQPTDNSSKKPDALIDAYI